MRTNVADTSLSAYRTLSGCALNQCQLQILGAMKPEQLYTRRELEALTGMRSGTVCGRVFELIKAGLLKVSGEKLCSQSGLHVEALRRVSA